MSEPSASGPSNQRPMRLLLLCDRLDIAGGVERFVCALANTLAREGMQVAVGTVSTPRSALRYPLDAAVRVLAGREMGEQFAGEPASKAFRAWHLLRTQWRIGRALSRVARADVPDVIVLNGLTTACSMLLLDRRFAARTICCDHNHFGARSATWQRLRAWLYRKVGAVVSLTEADAPKFRALNPRTQVIYNASTLQAEAPALPERPIALAVGRHVAQKGFDLLLHAWVAVAKAMPEAQLRILGDGPLRASHEELARTLGIDKTVRWISTMNVVEPFYREAAVFVLSSRYEGMPIALLEAQALGVPAVAFDCPTGPGEIVTPDTGRLVKANDVQELAAALIELLSAPDLRARMGRAAIERSRAVFSPQLHEQAWVALVREVAVTNAYAGAAAP